MIEHRGRVVKKPFGLATKSEHEAVKLVTPEGEYRLRRQGGNPFADPVLDLLVGKTIRCRGVVSGNTLIITEWSVEGD